MYTKIVAQSDAKKKGALFDSKTTHVGIQCGCHISKEDYCCFSYGVNVKEKSGVELLGVINVDKQQCDESSESWHKGVKGENFKLENPNPTPVPAPAPVAPTPAQNTTTPAANKTAEPPSTYVPNLPVKETTVETYEKLSK